MDQVTLLFPQIEMKKEGKEYGKALKKKKNQITGFLNCNSIKVILQLRQSNDHIAEICNTQQELGPRAVHTYYWQHVCFFNIHKIL